MNKIEIRDYLQSIYKVPVSKVNTHIQHGLLLLGYIEQETVFSYLRS